MLWRTHTLAGLNTLWILSLVPDAVTVQSIAPLILLSAVGALLPDLDAIQSKIKNVSLLNIYPLVNVSLIVNRLFGHRGAMHSPGSLLIVGVLSLPLALWLGWPYSAALWLGYASHLIMDACTIRGIPLFPFSTNRGHLLPTQLRIVTGSEIEEACLAVLAVSFLLFLLNHLSSLIS